MESIEELRKLTNDRAQDWESHRGQSAESKGSADLYKVFSALWARFPGTLFNSVSDGVEIFALSDEEDVVAFFCTLRKGKYYYLFYLAVDEDKRGKGIGSDILSAVIKNADGATVFLDCEGIYPGCKDRAARVKRLCFYHRNGFKEIGPLKTWRGEKFRTLVYGDKEISEQEIEDFWEIFGHLWEGQEIATIPAAPSSQDGKTAGKEL